MEHTEELPPQLFLFSLLLEVEGSYERVDKTKSEYTVWILRATLAQLGWCSASTRPAGTESQLRSSFLALGFVGRRPPYHPSDSCRLVPLWPWADGLEAVCLMYDLYSGYFTWSELLLKFNKCLQASHHVLCFESWIYFWGVWQNVLFCFCFSISAY